MVILQFTAWITFDIHIQIKALKRGTMISIHSFCYSYIMLSYLMFIYFFISELYLCSKNVNYIFGVTIKYTIYTINIPTYYVRIHICLLPITLSFFKMNYRTFLSLLISSPSGTFDV